MRLKGLLALALAASSGAERRRVLVNLVVAAEDDFLLTNLAFFLAQGATPARRRARVAYRVTLNGPNPRAAALVAAHNAARDPGLSHVTLLERANSGFDFGGHLDALADEAACGGGGGERLEGGVPLGRANHARCYLDRYADVRARLRGDERRAYGHFHAHGRAEGRRFACDVSDNERVSCGGAARRLDFEHLAYDVFVGLNVGVRGPFHPAYMPRGWHWTSAFLDALTALDDGGSGGNAGVALAGTVIACLNEPPPPRKGGVGPRVEGFAFALSRPALLHVLENGTSFGYHKDKHDAIVFGEYALSLDVLHAAGRAWNLGSLLVEHRGVDFRDERNWRCNGAKHPTRAGSHHGLSVHPLEVLFHKPKWHTLRNYVSTRETESLTARVQGTLY